MCVAHPYLLPVSHAAVNSTNFSYPNTIHVICSKSHWLPETHANLFCNSSGQWSPSPLQCRPVYCPELKNTSEWFVHITTADYTVGSTATYWCSKGYSPGKPQQSHNRSTPVAAQTCITAHPERTTKPIGQWSPALSEILCAS